MTARLFDHAEGRGGRTGVDDGRPGRVPALIREAALIALAAGLYTLVEVWPTTGWTPRSTTQNRSSRSSGR